MLNIIKNHSLRRKIFGSAFILSAFFSISNLNAMTAATSAFVTTADLEEALERIEEIEIDSNNQITIEGQQLINELRTIFRAGLSTPDPKYAVEGLGRLAYIEGFLYYDPTRKAEAIALFFECKEAAKNIAGVSFEDRKNAEGKLERHFIISENINKVVRTFFYNWYSTCAVHWVELKKNNMFFLAAFAPSLKAFVNSALNTDLEIDSKLNLDVSYYGGGIYRAITYAVIFDRVPELLETTFRRKEENETTEVFNARLFKKAQEYITTNLNNDSASELDLDGKAPKDYLANKRVKIELLLRKGDVKNAQSYLTQVLNDIKSEYPELEYENPVIQGEVLKIKKIQQQATLMSSHGVADKVIKNKVRAARHISQSIESNHSTRPVSSSSKE